MKLLIINGSVRDGNASARVTKWVEAAAHRYLTDAEIEVVDLKTLALPLFTDATPPMMQENRQPEGAVKTWLDALESADAYVFVTPEYNHGIPGSLKDAIDHIDYQLTKKPFMAVSHGGVGGSRAIEQLRLVLNSNLGAVPIPDSISVFGYVGYENSIDEHGAAQTEAVKKSESALQNALETLHWYATALKAARE
ncbi:MAG: NAD(P)H-dependent oxidoreductase [Candidatus Saccharimonadales bacterium]